MRNFFQNFPQTDVDIIDQLGNKRCTTKALIGRDKDTGKDTVTIPDSTVEIEIGDEIRRKLPNGKEETFTVHDPRFIEEWRDFPAYYIATISRKGAFAAGTGGNYNIHVSGANSRVNIGSTDNSRNIVSTSDVFADIKGAVDSSSLPEAVKDQLRQATDSMEQSKDRDSFVLAYQNFISTAADHMTILAPFLPALSKLLSG